MLIEQKDGDERPGQKGLALSASQWATLRCHIEDIQQAVKDENCEYLLELGNNRRATVGAYKDSLNINLREYYDKGGELAPGECICYQPLQAMVISQCAEEHMGEPACAGTDLF